MRSRSPFVWALLCVLFAFCLPSLRAQTPSIYPNAIPISGILGAIEGNALWQLGNLDGKNPRPLVQIQGAGGDDLLNQAGYGVSTSRLTAATTDWLEVDWMRHYLAPTGEFPGNGNTTPGNNFFDMMNGMASFTRGARAISQAPAWDTLYHSKVLEETAVWNTVCQWLTTPAVKAVGDAYNAPDTHRYWMSASVLRNEAYLLRLLGGSGNVSQAAAYDAIALDYENQGLALQKGPGWRLALYPALSSGLPRASILYNPVAGDAIPLYFDGTVSSKQISGEGVRPEQGDNNNETWDAIYNPNGDKLAVWGVPVQAAGAHRQACVRAVDVNLLCAMQFLTNARDDMGAAIIITPNGSGRVGSLDINGNPKKIDPKAWRSIFQVQGGLAPDASVYAGSSDPNCRALFAAVFHWLDNIIRYPANTIPAPPVPATFGVTYPTVAPSAPGGLTATAGDTTVALSWTASTGAATYSIYRGTSSGAETLLQAGLTATVYADSGLTDGQAYFYRVTATGDAGTSPYSTEATATPQAALVPVPPAPSSLSLTASNAACALSWGSSAGAASYTVYRGTAAGQEVAVATGLTVTTYSDTNVSNGTAYYYRVTAVNANGESSLSPEVSGTPQAPAAPAMVRPGVPIIRLGAPWRGGPLIDGRQQSYNLPPQAGESSRYRRAA